jgi:hypothetical protein
MLRCRTGAAGVSRVGSSVARMTSLRTVAGVVTFREIGVGDYGLFAQLADGVWGGCMDGSKEQYLDILSGQLLRDRLGPKTVLADIGGELVGITSIEPDSDVHTDRLNGTLRPLDVALKPGHDDLHAQLVTAAAVHVPAGFTFLVHTATVAEVDRFRAEGWSALAPGDALGWCSGASPCRTHQAEPDSGAEVLVYLPLRSGGRLPHTWIVPEPDVDSDDPPQCRVH